MVKTMRHGLFRGVVESGFSTWLGSRWRLTGGRLVAPVSMNFLRQKDPPWPALGPNQRAMTPANYTFHSTLQLSLALPAGVPAFHSKTAAPNAVGKPALPALSLRLERERWFTERSMLVTERLLREFGAASRLPGGHIPAVRHWPNRARASSLIFGRGGLPLKGILGARPKGLWESSASSGTITSPALIPIAGAQEGRPTRFFPEKLVSPALFQHNSRFEIIPRSRMTFSLRSIFSLSNHALRTLVLRDGAKLARAGETVAHSQWPTRFLKSPGAKSGPVPGGSFMTAIQLTFVAPKPSDSEAATRQVSRFTQSPPLYYARRGATQDRGLASALRDLQQSLGEIKAMPPPAIAPQIDHLTRQVYDQLQRELRIEKERRGL